MKIKKLSLAIQGLLLSATILVPMLSTPLTASAAVTGVGTQSTTATQNALQAVTAASDATAIQAALQNFLNQYSVTSIPQCDLAVLSSYLHSCQNMGTANFAMTKAFANAFVEEWSKYTPTFIQAVGLQKIYFVDHARQGTNDEYAVGSQYANPQRFMYYDTETGGSTYPRAELIHHEFFHYIDTERFGDISNGSDSSWTALNPQGFSYLNSNQSCYQTSCPTGEHPVTGFATGYATTREPEDRAETAAYLLETGNYQKLSSWIATDTALANKVTYIKNIFKAIDPAMNDTYFTAMHTYANTNYDLPFYTELITSQTVTGLHRNGLYQVNNGGVLTVDGIIGGVTVAQGGTLKGVDGIIADQLSLDSGAILAPGHSPGCVTVGDLVEGGTYQAELGGTTACSGYDQIIATKSVVLGNCSGFCGQGSVMVSGLLEVSLYGGFVPKVGDSFKIIDNQSSSAVSNNFQGLGEGAQFTQAGVTYAITYKGGDGNDVVLSVTNVSSSVVPGVPNTGFKLVTTNPLVSLITSTLAALALFVMARRMRPATKR